MKIMIVGTTSGAGKTVITAILCRYLRRQGLSVVPFKTLNLSLNSHVTSDGGEIGMAQAFQAWACGLEPDVRMNPVLLKPKGNRTLQVILRGRPWKDVGPGEDSGREHMMSEAMDCLQSLEKDFETVVIEGSGSPAELNLRDQDIANMRTARESQSPVIIVGDIDKGGVFAGILGTYMLLEERDRHLVKGFIINRFRGDGSILASGIHRLEAETGLVCLGVMPFMDLRLPQEDSMFLGQGGRMDAVNDIREGWMKNLDRMTDEAERNLDFSLLMSIMQNGV